MLGCNMQSTLLHTSKINILYQCTGPGNYIVSCFVWNYKNKHVTLYMSVYVEGAMHEYQHKMPTRTQHAPQNW